MMPLVQITGSVKAIAVFDLFVVEVENRHRPNISEPVLGWKRNFGEWQGRLLLKENERAGGRVSRED
jgi:hypothetical protein